MSVDGVEKEQISNVFHLADKYNIQFIRLQFTDILGAMKNVTIPLSQLRKALDGEIMFDGSSIEGFVRIEESDMYLRPDPETFLIYPWLVTEGGAMEARLVCDVYNYDRSPFEGCPRNALQRVLAEAGELGYRMCVGPELEFFLFQMDDLGRPTTITQDKAGYFDMAPVDKGEEARHDIVVNLQKMGFEIEASHHETAPGQHEIDFKYANALEMADKMVTFRFVVRSIAQRHGLHASFMPKPIKGVSGSGMHVNQSLFREDRNAFINDKDLQKLSKIAYQYIAGVLAHAKAFTAVTNPTVNSYKRLVTGYEAPCHIAWSERNRSPLIRIPSKRGMSTRIEIRSADPSCNPYLALAVQLKAGLDGIKNEMKPPAPVDFNIFDLTDEELSRMGIEALPGNLKEALGALTRDEVIREALGPHIYSRFLEAKSREYEEYNMTVHDWEIRQYLATY
ncbi:MAG: type I glutamate--ammonia ligase [Peptococcaceae bacterium]|nr:type I glutamate--ammonia ligase [Peptococcaceae bacterium]